VEANMTEFSQMKRIRILRGLSQAEVSKRTGINYADISRIENGVIKPNAEKRALLAHLFDVPESILFPFFSEAKK
jgi:transcriptional regulator with XRE-family HTH domain